MSRRILRNPSRRYLHRSASLFEPLEERLAFTVFTVGNILDSGAGSLRQAIIDANNTPGADTIVFAPAFSSALHTISLLAPLPQMSGQLTVTGPGSNLLIVRRDTGIMTIFAVFSSTATALGMSGMTVTGGETNGAGGGLFAGGPGAGDISLNDMVFTDNRAAGFGGGIYVTNDHTLTIRNSKITGNTAAGGGGIFFFAGGSLVMENTTISGNTALQTTSGGGGGLYFAGTVTAAPPAGYMPGTLLIRNSTFSSNNSARVGGGIMVDGLIGALLVQNSTVSGNTAATLGGGLGGASGSGDITVQNSTIAGNTASGTSTLMGGGGIGRTSILNNSLTLVNTIVSGNTNPGGGAPDIRTDAFTTTHVNFSAIGSNSGFTGASGSGNNLPAGANLMLGALADNGGPTQTRAVLSGSPLINAGSNAATPAALTTDQRGSGFPRILGTAVDIGAFERDSVRPTVVSAQYLYLTPPRALRFTFSENVGASLSLADLVLRNLTTNTTIPSANLALTYDATANTGTVTSPGYALSALPDGNYRATLTASGVTDASGNALASDFVFDFFVLAGDANRDRKVDFNDLVLLAQNYNAASGKTWAQADFTGDGAVNFNDLVILAQRYNTTLPAAAPAAAPLPVLAAVRPADENPLLDRAKRDAKLFSVLPVRRGGR
ncbi:MAG TPA: choice-of-anchor Q domain-containing protein [Tepidisphaeraceae bacterium]